MLKLGFWDQQQQQKQQQHHHQQQEQQYLSDDWANLNQILKTGFWVNNNSNNKKTTLMGFYPIEINLVCLLTNQIYKWQVYNSIENKLGNSIFCWA